MASLQMTLSLQDKVQDASLTQRDGRGTGADKAILASTAVAAY